RDGLVETITLAVGRDCGGVAGGTFAQCGGDRVTGDDRGEQERHHGDTEHQQHRGAQPAQDVAQQRPALPWPPAPVGGRRAHHCAGCSSGMSSVHVELYWTPPTVLSLARLIPGTISGTNGPFSCMTVAYSCIACSRSSIEVAFAAASTSSPICGAASASQPARRPTFCPGPKGRKEDASAKSGPQYHMEKASLPFTYGSISEAKGAGARSTLMPICFSWACTRSATGVNSTPPTGLSLGNCKVTFSPSYPDSSSAALARSTSCCTPCSRAPRNIGGITPVACTEPVPASLRISS